MQKLYTLFCNFASKKLQNISKDAEKKLKYIEVAEFLIVKNEEII